MVMSDDDNDDDAAIFQFSIFDLQKIHVELELGTFDGMDGEW